MKLRNCQRVVAVVFLLSVSLVHGHLRKTNFEPTSFVADGDPAREEGLEVNRTGTELPLVVVPVAVMPETLHIKKRGEGYAKGSPLYDKQERAEGSHATRQRCDVTTAKQSSNMHPNDGHDFPVHS